MHTPLLLLPYLDPIVQRLLKLLNNPAGNPSMVRRYVQEQAITTLAMVGPFTRDKVVQTHTMYPNSYIKSSYAARMKCQASAPDAWTQLFKQVVSHYYIAWRLFTLDKVVQNHSVYPNSYIISSYAARTMYRASARDDRVQLLKPLVKPGNALLTNCGVSTVDRIYPVKPDPHRKPDVVPSSVTPLIHSLTIYIYTFSILFPPFSL